MEGACDDCGFSFADPKPDQWRSKLRSHQLRHHAVSASDRRMADSLRHRDSARHHRRRVTSQFFCDDCGRSLRTKILHWIRVVVMMKGDAMSLEDNVSRSSGVSCPKNRMDELNEPD